MLLKQMNCQRRRIHLRQLHKQPLIILFHLRKLLRPQSFERGIPFLVAEAGLGFELIQVNRRLVFQKIQN